MYFPITLETRDILNVFDFAELLANNERCVTCIFEILLRNFISEVMLLNQLFYFLVCLINL